LGVRQHPVARGVLTASTLILAASGALARSAAAQDGSVPPGEWRYWGATASSTRYSPLDQINADNFQDLEIAWIWRGDNFGPRPDYILRSVPLYVDGKVFTVAGRRRTVAALDAGTGETLWTFREPNTQRWEDSPRQNWGKGVAYAEIDGRGVIYMTSPGFFLHALDANTGHPIEGFGKPVPIPGFAPYGTVDMFADMPRVQPYDPYEGPDPSLGLITTSSPPIVVNGVVIVGSALSDGGSRQTRIENIPGDVLAYDARTGEHLWTFHTIPQPGEFGYDTWEPGAWEWSGNVAAWPPLSADLERGIVYLPMDSGTNDVYGGFRPGDNLFANSIVAVDARTGERLWHQQLSHHDIWDWDMPVPPILADLNVDGREIPAVIQVTKQAFAFTFNRVTGEPVWPIEERPVPQSKVPGEHTAPTQPYPTRPASWELQGLTEDDLVDFTPELRQKAIESLEDYTYGPLFNPPVHEGNEEGKVGAILCPSTTGGTNVTGGPAFDPETNVLYVASVRSCSALAVVPGSLRDDGTPGESPGRTVADWVRTNVRVPSVDGIPIVKPPYGLVAAIDMNTGEHLWTIPNGATPERIAENELLQGLDIPPTGQSSHANILVTGSLLMFGEGRSGTAWFHAVDKATGESVADLPLPAPTHAAPMTFMHEGRQYVVVAVSDNDLPGSLVALRLPE